MADVIAFLTEYVEEIFVALLAIHAAAVAVANITPTPKDNAFLEKVYRVIEVCAGIFTKTARK